MFFKVLVIAQMSEKLSNTYRLYTNCAHALKKLPLRREDTNVVVNVNIFTLVLIF